MKWNGILRCSSRFHWEMFNVQCLTGLRTRPHISTIYVIHHLQLKLNRNYEWSTSDGIKCSFSFFWRKDVRGRLYTIDLWCLFAPFQPSKHWQLYWVHGANRKVFDFYAEHDNYRISIFDVWEDAIDGTRFTSLRKISVGRFEMTDFDLTVSLHVPFVRTRHTKTVRRGKRAITVCGNYSYSPLTHTLRTTNYANTLMAAAVAHEMN